MAALKDGQSTRRAKPKAKPTGLTKRSRGREVIFPPEVVFPPIFAALSNGLSLVDILKMPGMPSYDWCMYQLRDNPELKQRYRAAIESRGSVLADEILNLADSEIPEYLDGAERGAWVANKRLQIDARKWLACKLFPRQYGDRMEVETTSYQSISITAAMKRGEARGIEMLREWSERALDKPLDVEARTADRPIHGAPDVLDDDDSTGIINT
jgi:hypothetical protein